MRKVFLEKLPKKGTQKINWEKSIGYKVHFVYDDIEDDIEIINYIKVKGKRIYLLIKYKEIEFKISPSHFRKCQFGNLLNKKTNNFKIKIGTIFIDNKRDIVIIDRKTEKRNNNKKNNCNFKYYKYHCNKCGAEFWIEESNLLRHKVGCACCSNQTVVKGINDIATTNPEMIKYFANIEDIYTHNIGSNKKALCKCPNCGLKKEMIINNLYKKGFSCPQCSDGISYPNKFMFNLLQQLKEDNIIDEFETEKRFDWCVYYNPYKNKKCYGIYDFYIPSMNLVIEMDGELGHKGGKIHGKSNKILKECIERDEYKDNLAKEYSLQIIRINCIYKHYDRFEYIKNNIIKSKLNEIFDLSNIDWRRIGQDSEKSLVKKVCDYYKNNIILTTTEIGKYFNMNRSTIREYLKKGNKLGWCNYDGNINIKNIIKIYKNNKCAGICFSIKILEKKSKSLYGICFDHKIVSKIINKKLDNYKGFSFEKISKEEYINDIEKNDVLYIV